MILNHGEPFFAYEQPTEERRVGRNKRTKGARVWCNSEKGSYYATIEAFMTRSAYVIDEKTGDRRVCSYRNIYDPETNKPYKATSKDDASVNGYQNAFIPPKGHPQYGHIYRRSIARKGTYNQFI